MIDYLINWGSKLPSLQGKEKEILNLHLNEKIPVAQLAKTYNCDRKPIQNIITKNGFKLRPSSSPKLDGREEDILKMYLEDQLTIQTIHKKIGCCYDSIHNFLRRNNVHIRTAEESRNTEDGKVKGTTQRLTTPEELEDAIQMYRNGEVLETIGEKYNISPVGLRIKFLKHGIELRTQTESANLPTTYERKKVSYMKKYGVENPMQHPDVITRSKNTSLEKYGVEYPMQNAEVNERATASAHRFKSVDIHGRRFNHLQGYEPQGIAYLIEKMGVDVNNIQSGRKIPTIQYTFQGKKKTYFPDMYVEDRNLLVEIKCNYTYIKELEKNMAKREATLNSGYNFITIIFDEYGKDVIKLF